MTTYVYFLVALASDKTMRIALAEQADAILNEPDGVLREELIKTKLIPFAKAKGYDFSGDVSSLNLKAI